LCLERGKRLIRIVQSVLREEDVDKTHKRRRLARYKAQKLPLILLRFVKSTEACKEQTTIAKRICEARRYLQREIVLV